MRKNVETDLSTLIEGGEPVVIVVLSPRGLEKSLVFYEGRECGGAGNREPLARPNIVTTGVARQRASSGGQARRSLRAGAFSPPINAGRVWFQATLYDQRLSVGQDGI
jgi:hypothetical protein